MKVLKLDGERDRDDFVSSVDAYYAGVQDVLRIRCIHHRSHAQYNNSAEGAECTICAIREPDDEERAAMDDAVTALLIDEDTRNLDYAGVHRLAERVVAAVLGAR